MARKRRAGGKAAAAPEQGAGGGSAARAPGATPGSVAAVGSSASASSSASAPASASLSGVPSASAAARAASLPAEITGRDLSVGLFAAMMFLAPAIGVPHEEMLQDTLKSIIVSFAALLAALAFLWNVRERTGPLRWHALLWLPLALMAYALGSMAWSHTYLGGVEAIRWFVFSLIAWVGLNTLSRDRLPWLAAGIHAGAFVASLWAVMQFVAGMSLFPQGPNPASTFINRNFFAEFAVSTLPFGAMLLAQSRASSRMALLAITNGLVIAAILMTGTRAALMALWLQLLVVLPLIAWRCRASLAARAWPHGQKALCAAVLLGTVIGLGILPSSNPKILEEQRGSTGIERGFRRTQSIGPQDASLGIRMVMWRATMDVIRARPLSGVGAGAWESEIPLYQAKGSQLETDYYVHNEFLQLVAEYGLVGWAFLLLLAGYLLDAAWRTWRAARHDADADARAEAPWRAMLLCSLLAFFIVSNVGFPWRMATTGALFALCLAALAASDARLALRRRTAATPMRWSPALSRAAGAAGLCCLALAAYISALAAESESKIVHAAKIAISITAAGDPTAPRWNEQKREMLRLIKEGTDINPHYRKITPIVADELAKWGDWKNATWIWESVLSSRPYVVAILSNVARGHASMGNLDKAREYLQRAQRIQPGAPAVRSLEVVLLVRAGDRKTAMELGRKAIEERAYDFDLLNAVFHLGWQLQDYPLALQAMKLRVTHFPESRTLGYMQLGRFYLSVNMPERAEQAYREGMQMASPAERSAYWPEIPGDIQAKLQALQLAPASAPQTSSSSR